MATYRLYTGRKTVTLNGTAEALTAGSTPAAIVVITAESNNTNAVTVGGAEVVGAVATRQGTPLNAGDHVTFYEVNLAEIYVDSITNTEGVTFTYEV